MIIGEHRPMRLSFAQKLRPLAEFLKAEEFQRNFVILTGKYNKEYRLHVARQFCMLCKTLSLCVFLCGCVCVCVCERDKATASRALHTRVYGTSNTATLRIHSDELKNKMVIIL